MVKSRNVFGVCRLSVYDRTDWGTTVPRPFFFYARLALIWNSFAVSSSIKESFMEHYFIVLLGNFHNDSITFVQFLYKCIFLPIIV